MALDAYANRLRKEEWFVKDISMQEAKSFIVEHHYARGCSHTRVYSHGLFHHQTADVLMGVALWLPPTKVAAQSVNDNWQRVLSLPPSRPPLRSKKRRKFLAFPKHQGNRQRQEVGVTRDLR